MCVRVYKCGRHTLHHFQQSLIGSGLYLLFVTGKYPFMQIILNLIFTELLLLLLGTQRPNLILFFYLYLSLSFFTESSKETIRAKLLCHIEWHTIHRFSIFCIHLGDPSLFSTRLVGEWNCALVHRVLCTILQMMLATYVHPRAYMGLCAVNTKSAARKIEYEIALILHIDNNISAFFLPLWEERNNFWIG